MRYVELTDHVLTVIMQSAPVQSPGHSKYLLSISTVSTGYSCRVLCLHYPVSIHPTRCPHCPVSAPSYPVPTPSYSMSTQSYPVSTPTYHTEGRNSGVASKWVLTISPGLSDGKGICGPNMCFKERSVSHFKRVCTENAHTCPNKWTKNRRQMCLVQQPLPVHKP